MSTAHAAATGGEQFASSISTVAGTGVAGREGDDKPAFSAQLNRPYAVAMDSAGTLYIVDHNNHRVRKVTTDGQIRAVAGTGVAGPEGDSGPAALAQLNGPRSVAADSTGVLYIADSGNHRVRKVTADGKISTIVGTGTAGRTPDGERATDAQLNVPAGVAVDSIGTLYVSDLNNHQIRKVTTDGRISTLAGTGVAGPGGDDGLAVSAQLNSPYGLAVDGAGDVYVADSGNHRVRKVTADGKISTVVGTGIAGHAPDGSPATSAQLHLPVGVAVDSAGNLYIADHHNHQVRKVTTEGKISTVAGTGAATFGGDDSPADSAQLNFPHGLAVDCVDALYIADSANHRVRKVASAKMTGLPDSGTVVSWANVRSRLRMAVTRESTKDGAEVHQTLTVPRDHQRWRLIVAGHDNGDVLYRIENVRSGKVLEIVGAQKREGAVIAQRAYEGGDAYHQQWRLIAVGSVTDIPRVYEIANRNSGLLLRADTNARTVIKQYGAEGDRREWQWQLLPV
ncbi:RICIN domain-containing protein [Streptomyces sp. NPDC006285]|uniref:NHL domain-containing protein n=1 Tax=Streptomyces sp. NPDC006285 TaxID=3364742 RepID=UPI00369CA030